MKETVDTCVVPAHLGFYTVYDLDDPKEIVLGEPVIAWRILNATDLDPEDFCPLPITIDGGAPDCIGVQNPDMTVTVFDRPTYSSLTELQQHRYPEE